MLNLLWSRSQAGAEVDEDAELDQLEQQIPPATIAAFAGSSELPSSPTADAEVRQLLARYYRAEKRDVGRAARRLEEQAAWRRGFGSVNEEDVAADLAGGKVKLQLPTSGSSGRPLLIVKARSHFPGATPQSILNFIYYCLEAASHYCWDPRSPDGKLATIIDLGGLKLKNLDSAALRAAFVMLAQHFPERQFAVWMVDAPTIFWGIWKFVEPFIDSTARKSISFVFGKAGRKTLVQSLGTEIVPVEYGGEAAELPVEVAAGQLPTWRRALSQQQQRKAERPALPDAQQVGTTGAEGQNKATAAVTHVGTCDLQQEGSAEGPVAAQAAAHGLRLSHSTPSLA